MGITAIDCRIRRCMGLVDGRAKMSRKTNQQLCAEFRALLTEGAREEFAKHSGMNDIMTKTREYRNKLWKAFREIEDRLCPVEAMERNRNDR